MIHKRSVGILGTGNVGSHCAYALAAMDVCDEVVLMDILKEKAQSEALDIADAAFYLPGNTAVRSGEMEKEAKNLDIIVISFGKKPDPSQDRLDMLKDSLTMVKEEIPKIMEAGFDGIFLVISNPVDVITYFVQKISGLPKNRVIGTGTGMDSARLCKILSDEIRINPKSIEAVMMGEHGASQMTPWSQVRIAGRPILELLEADEIHFNGKNLPQITEEVRQRGYAILKGKGCTEFGIGTTLAYLVEVIFRNQRKMIVVSAFLQGEYGESGLYAGVPCIISANGVEEVLEYSLTKEELLEFRKSCTVLKNAIRSVE